MIKYYWRQANRFGDYCFYNLIIVIKGSCVSRAVLLGVEAMCTKSSDSGSRENVHFSRAVHLRVGTMFIPKLAS